MVLRWLFTVIAVMPIVNFSQSSELSCSQAGIVVYFSACWNNDGHAAITNDCTEGSGATDTADHEAQWMIWTDVV